MSNIHYRDTNFNTRPKATVNRYTHTYIHEEIIKLILYPLVIFKQGKNEWKHTADTHTFRKQFYKFRCKSIIPFYA